MMVTSKILVVLCLLFCELDRVFLFNRCSAPTEPGVISCAGKVWTEPARVILMGQNISINCHSPTELCKKAKLQIELNDVHVEDEFLSVINKTTVQLLLQNFHRPFSTIVCYAHCPKAHNKVVCGTEFCMGYSPDRPANLTCFIHEHSENMTCIWDPGKDTHLKTRYNVCLESLQTKENNTFSSSNSFCVIPLTHLQKKQTFHVWVYAENYLGTVHSDPLYVDLKEIVIPATPAITQAETVDYPVFKTVIKWEKQSEFNDTYCEERYKELASETWHVRELVDFRKDHYTEYNLDANTKYEFQVRCKLIQIGRFWSTWSDPVTYITPEAEPSSIPNVWRSLGPNYPNGSREVTILIKPFHPKESRGQILGYRVFCENQGENMTLCNTTETKCNVLVPGAVTCVYVTAINSKASSKAAFITVNQQSFNYHDFPPPTHVLIRDGQNGISVMWGLPIYTGKLVLWYIVEWTYAGWNSRYQQNILWEKVPRQNTTYIPGDNRMKSYFNISVYAVYRDGISEACSAQSHSDRLLKKLPDGQADGNAGVLLGTGVAAAFLFFFLLALITKKSFRQRISTAFVSVTPKWLLEDYPQVQKSSVNRLLQERNNSMMPSFSWLFLDYEDTVVTEVQETLGDKECKPLSNNRETKEAVSEIVLPETPFVNSSDTKEENGYKPQVCNEAPFLSSPCETHSPNLDTKPNLPASLMNISIKDYMSSVTSIWPAESMDDNRLLLEKANLILSNSESGQNNIFTSTHEERNRATENPWKFQLSENKVQEQTLIPDELLSCLTAVNENSTDFLSYFPQSIAK